MSSIEELRIASKNGDLAEVRRLLDVGTNVNAADQVSLITMN